MKTRHSFLFLWPGIHWFFGQFWWYSRILLAVNLETMVVFMKFGKKKAETNWASAWALGPNQMPKWFQHFFWRSSWIPPWFQDFTAKSIREYHQNCPKNQWIPGHKNKKICRVFIEIQHWWYLGQKYSCYCNDKQRLTYIYCLQIDNLLFFINYCAQSKPALLSPILTVFLIEFV